MRLLTMLVEKQKRQVCESGKKMVEQCFLLKVVKHQIVKHQITLSVLLVLTPVFFNCQAHMHVGTYAYEYRPKQQ
jgi:hypothetical protein